MSQDPQTPLDRELDARRKQLSWRWRDLADNAGVSEETIRQLRRGSRDRSERVTDTEGKVERAVGWERGSIAAIYDGHRPTVIQDPPPRRFDVITTTPTVYPPEYADDPFLRRIWDDPFAPEPDKRAACEGVIAAREERRKARSTSSDVGNRPTRRHVR